MGNYGAGRLLFPHDRFYEASRDNAITISNAFALAKQFGNTNTSTLWRLVENSDDLVLAAMGDHPHYPGTPSVNIEYFVRSKRTDQQFKNITETDIWNWKKSYCSHKRTGPLGSAEVILQDVNGTRHIFLFESFSIKHKVLTLARHLSEANIIA